MIPTKLFGEIRADARVGKFPSSVKFYGDDGQSGFQPVDHHLMLRTNQADAPIFVMNWFSVNTTLTEKVAEHDSSTEKNQEIILPKIISHVDGATQLLKQIRSYLVTLVALALIYIIHQW